MTRVLIADDEAVILLQLEDALGAMGFTVAALATSAAEAERMARETMPDVALLDVVMPGEGSGIEACRTLQTELGIPVVLMSAHGDETNLARAADAKPSGYVIKPFQPDQVAAALRMAVLAQTRGRLGRLIAEQEPGAGGHGQWNLALESLPLGAALCGPDGGPPHVNRAMRALFGGALGAPARLEDLPGVRELENAARDGGSAVFLPLPGNREIEARLTRLDDGGALLIYTDVTSQHRDSRTLAGLERILEAKHRIAESFLTITGADVYSRVAAVLANSFDSKRAWFGFLDGEDDLVLHSLAPEAAKGDARGGKHPVLPRDDWTGAWGLSLTERRTVLENDASPPPPGHPPLASALAVPVLYGTRLIGQFTLADKPGGFTPDDARALERVAAHCAPILQARLEREAVDKERAQASRDLLYSEQLHRQIVEAALEGIWTIDAGGLTTYVNRNQAQMLGYEPEAMLGRHYFEFMDNAALRDAERCLEKCRQGFSAQYDFRFKSASGADVWAICSTSPLTDSRGSYHGALVMTSDITYRKFAERSLLESEERLRQLVENLREVFWIRELRTRKFLYISPSFEKVWGQPPDRFLNTPNLMITTLHPEDRDRVNRQLHELDEGLDSQIMEYRIQRPDGGERWIRTSSLQVRDDLGRPFRIVALSEDITERRIAAQERDRLSQAIEQVGDIVLITDPRGTIQYANPAFKQISGLEPQEVLGRNMAILRSPLPDDKYLAELRRSLVRGDIWRGRYVYERPDGTRREVKASFSPILDEHGDVAHYVSVQRDVTEETQLENQLGQARKMEALGTLAGGIAHDFNNILMAILGFTELALGSCEPDGRQRAHLERVLQAGNRARDLVRQILAFSRRSELERAPLEPLPLVGETLKLLRATLPANIAISRDLAPDTGKVLADPGQIHQIVMNLATNAAHALDGAGGGTITVRLGRRRVEPGGLPGSGTPAPGDYVLLEVEDDGPGIPASIMDRIFDPFFTTKAPGEGTGMGLSVVHGTAHALGGTVRALKAQGGGSLFSVLLPLAPDQDKAAPAPGPRKVSGTERVLYVDDESDLTELALEGLGELGYRVTAVNSPHEALQRFADDPEDFDVLITDQAMPGLTGLEMVRSVRAIRDDLPVILCTGHSLAATPGALSEAGVSRLVGKPFSFDELSRALREVLDQAGG